MVGDSRCGGEALKSLMESVKHSGEVYSSPKRRSTAASGPLWNDRDIANLSGAATAGPADRSR